MLPRSFALALAALALSACTRTPDSARAASAGAASTPSPLGATTEHGAPGSAIKFIEDDYPKALAEAREKGLPLFVDAWAPWCHTCLSLRAFVLHDPALAEKVGARFVFLAIDTEKAQNAAFLAKYPLEFWPTLWVIDPDGEKPVMKWPGSLTTTELLALLDDSAEATKQKSTGGEAGSALLRGDKAVAEAKRDEAIRAYRDALAAAPPGWVRRARTVDALATQLANGDAGACLLLAETEGPKLAPGTNAANVVGTGLGCAAKLAKPASAPAPGTALAEAAARMAKDTSIALLADDRSGLFDALNDWLHEQGETAAPRRAENARAWAAFLEAQAKGAPTKEARVVFDAHRLSAYFALGDMARAQAMVSASEAEFPRDYNHPARLARVYLEMNRLDDAKREIDRALALAYGPRKLKLYELEARIATKKGDRAGAKQALETALKEAQSMTLTGSYAKTVADIKARAETP